MTEDVGDADATPDAPTTTPCGDIACDPGDVCVNRCLCCGVDTGNPDDIESEYLCVTPPEACEGRPSTCALELPGYGSCSEDSDTMISCPCA